MRLLGSSYDTDDWRTGLIVRLWKVKGDSNDLNIYQGIILLSQLLKVLEKVLDVRVEVQGGGKYTKGATWL